MKNTSKNQYETSLAKQPIVDTRKVATCMPYKAYKAKALAERKAKQAEGLKVEVAKTSTKSATTRKTAVAKATKTTTKKTSTKSSTTRKPATTAVVAKPVAQPVIKAEPNAYGIDYNLLAQRVLATALKDGRKVTMAIGNVKISVA